MANLQRLLTRRPQIDEAEVEDVRERTMARLAALNGDATTTETVEAAAVAEPPTEAVAPSAKATEPTATATTAGPAPTPVEPSPPKPAGPKIIVPRTISLGPPPAPTPAPAAEPDVHRAPPIIVLGEPDAAATADAGPDPTAAEVETPVATVETPTKVETPVATAETPAIEGKAILLGAPAPIADVVEAAAPVVAEPIAKAKPAPAKTRTAAKPTASAAVAKPASAKTSKPKATKPKVTAQKATAPAKPASAPKASASKPAAPKAATRKPTKRPATAIPVMAQPEPVIEPLPKVVRRDPSLPVPRVAVVADEWDTQEAAIARPAAGVAAPRPVVEVAAVAVLAEPVAVAMAEPVIVEAAPAAVAEPVAVAARTAAETPVIAVAAGSSIAVAEAPVATEPAKVAVAASAPAMTAPSQPKGRPTSSLLAKVAISRPTVQAARVVVEPRVVVESPVATEPSAAPEAPVTPETPEPKRIVAEAPVVATAPVKTAAPVKPKAPVKPEAAAVAPVRTTSAPAKPRPAPRPPVKGAVAHQPVQATAVAAAFCPYCALALEPAPTASRRCTRCKQRIVVKRVQGRIVYLTEAAVEVFESERLRSANFGRWAKERTQWLRLAKSVRADAGRIERLGAAPLSDKVVESAKTLYASTADRQYREAKREDRWEDASRLKREQASAMHRVAGSPATPTAEVLARYHEAVSTELRGIGKMAKEAALVGADCCDTCRADDGRTFKIAAELRTPRLPHEGCPKGLCYCRWDLTIRDRTMVERYLRRTVRPPKAKRPTA